MSPRAARTTTTAAKTPETDNALAHATATAEDFLGWWTAHATQDIADDADPSEVEVDTAAARDRAGALYAALAAAGAPASEVETVRAAVEGPLATSDRLRGRKGVSPTLARQRFAQAPALIRPVIAQALRPFDRADELAEAEAAAQTVQRALDDATDALQEAVEAGDVTRVMDIRGEVEVGLPVRLDRARLLVLDLRAHRAAHSTTAADEEATTARAAATAAEDAVQYARVAFDEATAALDAARAHANITGGHAENLRRTASELREEHDALARESKDSAQRRMRRLAGLANLPDVPVHEPDDTTPALEPLQMVQPAYSNSFVSVPAPIAPPVVENLIYSPFLNTFRTVHTTRPADTTDGGGQ